MSESQGQRFNLLQTLREHRATAGVMLATSGVVAAATAEAAHADNKVNVSIQIGKAATANGEVEQISWTNNDPNNCYFIEIQDIPKDGSAPRSAYGDAIESGQTGRSMLKPAYVGDKGVVTFYNCLDKSETTVLDTVNITFVDGFKYVPGSTEPTTPTTPPETTPTTTPQPTTPTPTPVLTTPTPVEVVPTPTPEVVPPVVVVTPPSPTPEVKPPVVVVVPPKGIDTNTCIVPKVKKNETAAQARKDIEKDPDCVAAKPVGDKGYPKAPSGKKWVVKGFATKSSEAVREMIGAKPKKIGKLVVVKTGVALVSDTALSPYLGLVKK